MLGRNVVDLRFTSQCERFNVNIKRKRENVKEAFRCAEQAYMMMRPSKNCLLSLGYEENLQTPNKSCSVEQQYAGDFQSAVFHSRTKREGVEGAP